MLGMLAPSMVPNTVYMVLTKFYETKVRLFPFIGRKTSSERMSFAQGMQLMVEPGLIFLFRHQRLALTLYHYKPLNRYSITKDSMQHDDKA